SEEKKQAILDELAEQGVLIDALAEEVGRDYEAFDLICHVAFGAKPLTRKERAQNVQKKDYFAKYGEQARAVLQALLEKYADRGITEIEGMNVLYLDPLNELGTPVELIQAFGGKEQYLQALKELEEHLYESA
ncbi:MAG: restriction endonuclease, partial [Leptospiraceae bacterium]|nr:restriction endonuclease [Leptospiraceae bacterium]